MTALDPGLCHSALTRNATSFRYWFVTVLKAVFARSTEVGSRTLVHAGGVGHEAHGKYLADAAIKE